MGNEALTGCVAKPSQVKINSCLTQEQITLVQETWKLLRGDLSSCGVIVFTRFFQTNAEMKGLFPKIITISEENRLEFVIDEKMLQKHATTVMEGLGAAVESLNNPYVLDNVLKAVGQTHARRQVKPIMLKKLWPALDFGLSETLQDNYTKEAADAWRKVYEYICIRMKEGMKDTDDELS
ncbi:cytoglobin-1-like [Liolophura sinensis]|uniref:cytoglobin-1-like n=1 Tax=Liolophura sinensis TaxID=3198878 RepID=UPI0031582DDB